MALIHNYNISIKLIFQKYLYEKKLIYIYSIIKLIY